MNPQSPSEDPSPSRFEQRLAEIPRSGLPPAFREEVLANACPPSELSPATRLWRATPKPLLFGLAAAWAAIAALQLTLPDSPGELSRSQPVQAEVQEARTRAVIAWVEGKHLEQP